MLLAPLLYLRNGVKKSWLKVYCTVREHEKVQREMEREKREGRRGG